MKPVDVLAFLFVLLGSLGGCSIVEPDHFLNDGSLTIRTEREEYRASGEALEVQVTIRNGYDAPVYIGEDLGSPVFSLEKLIDGTWTTAYVPIVTAHLKPPGKLEEGGVLASTFRIPYLKERDRYYVNWPVQEPLPGTYRFAVAIQKTRGSEKNLYRGEPLPEGEATSNAFQIIE